MSKITLDLIAETLKPNNWQVLSTEYKNLDTLMDFQCAQGHLVKQTWKKLRQQLECPICRQSDKFKDKYTSLQDKVFPKVKGKERVFALDQASHITGWAIFDGTSLIKYGIFKTDGEEMERYNKVKEWFVSMVEAWKPDLIGIEGIQYQEAHGVTTFQTLARLQGILMEASYELNIPLKVCPTNTWRAHCGVRGKTRSDRKTSMQQIVKSTYGVEVSDDIADAIGIGNYLASTHQKQTTIISWE